MKVSEYTIKAIGKIITGDGQTSPYRSGSQLVRFFNRFGARDVYPRKGGFPSRWDYAEKNLRRVNDTPEMARAVEAAVDPGDYNSTNFDVAKVINDLNHELQFDGYKLERQRNGLFAVRETGEPDWESGSLESFSRELQSRSGELPKALGESFLPKLAAQIEDIHSRERGMAEEFHDLARQRQLADLLVHSMTTALAAGRATNEQASSKPITIAYSRQEVVLRVSTLVAALQENLDVMDNRRNEPPSLDLALNENDEFVDEIRNLSGVLVDIRNQLQQHEVSEPSTAIAKDALREFVLKMSGSVGEGLGKTVTWGTRAALFWFAVNILKDFGVPIDGFIKAFSGSILPN